MGQLRCRKIKDIAEGKSSIRELRGCERPVLDTGSPGVLQIIHKSSYHMIISCHMIRNSKPKQVRTIQWIACVRIKFIFYESKLVGLISIHLIVKLMVCDKWIEIARARALQLLLSGGSIVNLKAKTKRRFGTNITLLVAFWLNIRTLGIPGVNGIQLERYNSS